jgi:hypothetical protein
MSKRPGESRAGFEFSELDRPVSIVSATDVGTVIHAIWPSLSQAKLDSRFRGNDELIGRGVLAVISARSRMLTQCADAR